MSPAGSAGEAHRIHSERGQALLAVLAIGLFIYQRFGSRLTNVSNTTANLRVISDKSIAVLPFDNLSRDPDNAYFCEGV